MDTTTEVSDAPVTHPSLEALTGEQLDVLRETGVEPPEDLFVIEGTDLHSFSVDGRAYSDGTYLVFIDKEMGKSRQDKFLYYMGAEREAHLVAKFRGVSIYAGINENRLEEHRP